MILELNKIYHMDNREGLMQLPEKSANLIISDPPYYEVKGEFDFVWKSFSEYLEFMEYQAQLYKRILADNGTLFVYGHAKRIAYVQVIFDKYFHLENNAVWHKYDAQTNKGIDEYECFAPVTERILFYSNGNSFSKVLRNRMKELNVSEMDFRRLKTSKNGNPTGWCSNIIKGKNEPTREDWSLICSIIGGFDYDTLKRTFNNSQRLTDVMRFSQEAHITQNYDHDTKKPETLTRALILTCSRPNDLVVVPFAGSGTECAMAAKEGCRFIGFDTTAKYVEMANNRVLIHLQQPSLFNDAA